MNQPPAQPQPQPPLYPVAPQYVVVPAQGGQRNGLGVFGFLLALVGMLIPTGIVSFLGLLISLAAIGRAPRAFAAFGVVLGLLGSVIWLVIGIVALVVGLVGAAAGMVMAAGMFVLTQPEVVEVTSDMVNVAVAAKEYEQDEQRLPDSLDDLDVSRSATIDPWGNSYLLTSIDEDPGFDLVSAGEDGRFDTDDDIRLTRLDRFWEDAFEDFERKAEAFGERLEALEHGRYTLHVDGSDFDCGASASDDDRIDYETKALQDMLKQATEVADKGRAEADSGGHR
jgi:hypothetical protein